MSPQERTVVFSKGASWTEFIKKETYRRETASTDCFSVLFSTSGGFGLFSSWIYTHVAFLFQPGAWGSQSPLCQGTSNNRLLLQASKLTVLSRLLSGP